MRVRDLDRLGPSERAALLARSPKADGRLRAAVERIVRAVRRDGDRALWRLTETFDRVRPRSLEVPTAELRRARPPHRKALDEMIARVRRFHQACRERPREVRSAGLRMGIRLVPFRRAGIYVPGGRAAYPSTVIMAAVPAKLAGVEEILLCTPPRPDGSVPAGVLYAARRCGVDRVFRVGGAQAVAAMAFGTRTIPRADIIVGPGNAYVATAKEIVSDGCRIDCFAGPTEIVIVSDGSSPARWIAADLAAQAEHDPDARCILVTTDRGEPERVASEIGRILPHEPRREIIRAALDRHGWMLVARNLNEAVRFANDYAPEHLVLAARNPRGLLDRVRNAGSVFLGAWSACAFGDYGAGPNHILPTAGQAARSDALGVHTFLRRVPYQGLSPTAARRLAASAVPLAEMEGLPCHARSMRERANAV